MLLKIRAFKHNLGQVAPEAAWLVYTFLQIHTTSVLYVIVDMKLTMMILFSLCDPLCYRQHQCNKINHNTYCKACNHRICC